MPLNAALAAHGLALENLGDIDVQTIAGAIDGTYGTGAALRKISAQVEAVVLVLADGETLACSEQGSPRCLSRRAGRRRVCLGVISAVTLRCVPAFTLRGVDRPAPLDETLARSSTHWARTNDHFEFFASPRPSPCSRARTTVSRRGRGRVRGTRAYAEDILLTNHADHAFCRRRACAAALHPADQPARDAASRDRACASTAVNAIFASPRLVRFTEMEYALPREHTAEAVRRVLEMIPARGFHVPFPIEVRLVADLLTPSS